MCITWTAGAGTNKARLVRDHTLGKLTPHRYAPGQSHITCIHSTLRPCNQAYMQCKVEMSHKSNYRTYFCIFLQCRFYSNHTRWGMDSYVLFLHKQFQHICQSAHSLEKHANQKKVISLYKQASCAIIFFAAPLENGKLQFRW